MKHPVKIGVVCLARKTFDYEAALRIYNEQRAALSKMESVEWVFIDGLTIEIEEARAAALRLAAAGLDGLVIISGTFHLGHLAPILVRRVARPALLWAFAELPYDGGKIRLNSACGVNLNASNLYKAGLADYDWHVGESIDADWVEALRVRAALENARIGLVGSHAHGFYNLEPRSLPTFREFGAMTVAFQLDDLYGIEPDPAAVKEEAEKARDIYDCSGISEEQLDKTARLAASIKTFMNERSLSAVALRCWPEFADRFGIAPCAAMSLAGGDGLLLACEGDVELALSMIALRALGDPAPYSADLSQVNFEDDYALMWHCGVAPCNLWDGKSVRSLDSYHMGGRGVTADFVMKEGGFTVCRLDWAHGECRALVARGESLGMDKELKGTYAKVRFESHVRDVYDTVVTNGFAHHVAMGYGDYAPALLKFARMSGMEVFG